MIGPKQLKIAYRNVFNTPEGRAVLKDMERIANQSRIDQDNPNPYACVYKIAQQSLIKRIENMLEPDQPDVPKNKLV